VLAICGSENMPGAALLCVRAAARAGAGLVTLTLFTRETVAAVAGAAPETLFLDLTRSKDLFVGRLPGEIRVHEHDSRVCGPGLGRAGRARELVRQLLADSFEGPFVLDADALNLIAPHPDVCGDHQGELVLTPHPGEAERLLERDVPADPAGRLDCARELAHRSQGICVLKGAGTVVTDGEQTHLISTGNPGMATGGSGDVLTGILGAYLAYGARLGDPSWTAWVATLAAVHVHGVAGDLAAAQRGERGLIASDLIDFLPAAQLHHLGQQAG
jgi:NAD(P)H-hydrate epimerase